MLHSIFRKNEHKFILSHLPQWVSFAGLGKKHDKDGDLYSERDNLVDSIISEFFSKFPERDITRDPSNSLAFNQKNRDKMHSVSMRSLP